MAAVIMAPEPKRLRVDPLGYRDRLTQRSTPSIVALMHLQVQRLQSADWDLLNLHFRDCARDVLLEREFSS
jgi:hypothetical protein